MHSDRIVLDADVAEGLDEGIEGAGNGLSQEDFEFGEGRLDRVQVGVMCSPDCYQSEVEYP
jgi:hypothetical protein